MAEFRLIDSSISGYQVLDLIMSRGFQYGDGFFESIMVVDRKVRLAEFHLERVQEALETLSLQSPFAFGTHDYLYKVIPSLMTRESCRLKLMVWRKGSGKYRPESNDADYVLIETEYEEVHEPITAIFIAANTFISHNVTSGFKTLSSLHYVMAGKEALKQGHDLILLTTPDGFLAEGIQSNLFLIREGVLLTPPLSSGCINGVVRRKLFNQSEITVKEHWFKVGDLISSDQLFLANVSGLRVLHQLENLALNPEEKFAEKLRNIIYKS